ncbi:MAG: transketolase [Magnetococcales bacterium]|nr:transketolase [Magnetococcales bacterium]
MLSSSQVQSRAVRMRRHALRMVHAANASHVGAGFSIADLLAVLYGGVLRVDPRNPRDPNRDRLILSKGHAAATLYAALEGAGFLTVADLESYGQDGAILAGHVSHHVPGVEFSTGSLGHGLPLGCGVALAGRSASPDLPPTHRAFVVMGDGEQDEGSVWEAALFAAHHRLDNLIALVDRNRLQGLGDTEAVLKLEPLADKWRAFGWAVAEADGHDIPRMQSLLSRLPLAPGQPSVIILHTVKGKGVSFMERTVAWHYRSPNAEQLAQALDEVGQGHSSGPEEAP